MVLKHAWTSASDAAEYVRMLFTSPELAEPQPGWRVSTAEIDGVIVGLAGERPRPTTRLFGSAREPSRAMRRC